jgi:hypothetical protein
LGGGALVTHAYTSGGFSGTSSSWGPVLGFEGRTQFARLFAARVRIEDYHYRLDHSLLGPLVGAGGPYTQNDVVVSAGLDVACAVDFDSECANISPTKRQTDAIAGARITGWIAPRFALDLAFGYSPSGLRGGINEPGSFAPVSARVLARVTPHASKTSVALIGGGALVMARSIYGVTSTNAFGPVFGLDARTHVGRLLAAGVTVEDYLWRSGSNTQSDVVVSAGLDVTLVGHQ